MRMDNHQRIGDNPIDNAGVTRLCSKLTLDGRIMRPAQHKYCRDKGYRHDKGRQHAEA